MVALGTDRTSAESLGLTTTTSTIYQPKLTLTTPNIAVAGDYVVFLTFQYQNNFTGDEDVQIEIVEDQGGPDIQIYETNRLFEANPGVLAGDSQEAYAICIRRTLAVGVHTYDVNFHRVGGLIQAVGISLVRMEFFGVDTDYQETIVTAASTTTSTAYVLKGQLNVGIVPAGTYRVGFSMEFKNEDPVNSNNMGCRFRMFQDAGGMNLLTNLLGAEEGNALELEVNNGGYGIGATDPFQQVSWWNACLELPDTDTYIFQVHFLAVGGAFDAVGAAQLHINFWETPQ